MKTTIDVNSHEVGYWYWVRYRQSGSGYYSAPADTPGSASQYWPMMWDGTRFTNTDTCDVPLEHVVECVLIPYPDEQ